MRISAREERKIGWLVTQVMRNVDHYDVIYPVTQIAIQWQTSATSDKMKVRLLC